jgi:hypothetical protein
MQQTAPVQIDRFASTRHATYAPRGSRAPGVGETRCAWRRACWLLVTATMPLSALAGIEFDSPERVFSDGMETSVRFHGEAGFLEPLAGAAIRVEGSDGSRGSGVADVEGRFAFKVEAVNPQAVITVSARGSGAQSMLEFASTLGDFGFLAETAGQAGFLTSAELPALKVNPHQTALHVGMRDLPPSVLSPPQGRAFSLQAGSWNAIDVFSNRGPLIALLAAGDLPLPDGAATTLEAISDLELAMVSYAEMKALPYEAVPGNPRFDAETRIGSDPSQVALLENPPLGVALHSYLPGSLITYMAGPRLELAADGSGLFGWSYDVSVAVDWSATESSTVFRLVRADGEPLSVQESFRFMDPCPIEGRPSPCQVRTLYTTTTAHVSFVTGPRNEIIFGVTGDLELRYPDNPDIPTQMVRSAMAPVTYHPALRNGLPRAAFEPGGKDLVLPRCVTVDCSPVEVSGTPLWRDGNTAAQEPHRFDPDGSGRTLRLDESFTWVVGVDGALTIDYSDGTAARFEIASHDRAYGTTTVAHILPTAEEFGFAAAFVPIQGSRAFSETDLVGHTFEQEGCDYPFGGIEGDSACDFNLIYAFESGGVGTALGGPMQWSIDTQGRVVIRRLASDGSLRQIRAWEMISEDADRIYVLQNHSTFFFVFDPAPTDFQPSFGPTTRISALIKR